MNFTKYLVGAFVFFSSLLPVSAQNAADPRNEYIDKYASIAIEQQALYGIPASITLAQGILESGCGSSRLATIANNHFGIKCGNDWSGRSLNHDDDAPQECFRSYRSVDESYVDHSLFLRERKRYGALFELDVRDYKAWARGLKAAGYATNPAYADMLIKIIEDYELYRYDTMTLAQLKKEKKADRKTQGDKPNKGEDVTTDNKADEEAVVSTIDVDNLRISLNSAGAYGICSEGGARYVVARNNDTIDDIASATGVAARRLRRYNNLSKNATIIAGERIFIE